MMEPIYLKPENEQRKIWFVIFNSIFWPIFLGLVMLLFFAPPDGVIVASIFMGIWILAAIPFLIYIHAYYKSLEYTITDDSVISKRGVFWKRHVTVPYKKITNVDLTQGPLQRRYKIGTLNIQTAGAGGAQGARPELRIVGVNNYDKVKDEIVERLKEIKIQKNVEREDKENLESKDNVSIQILNELKAIRKALESN